ncbi:C40 family peptidase [Bacillus cereus]|uniref:Gamma-D-glutamate-meso-diaminopimelate muropeptidase (Major autolysin) (CWBP49') n=1 Tax=Bacillus cereus TaxID=1396 RepID=A0A162PCX1_BACCE|nr:SH3 domain-containing C40 family peptidase [Bacillus cereus]KZD71172.1 gamma-D-glutamate-meso-diaminopimelate muropeptidase (major autolysin) (CWBP49') [Bacillus cereus]
MKNIKNLIIAGIAALSLFFFAGNSEAAYETIPRPSGVSSDVIGIVELKDSVNLRQTPNYSSSNILRVLPKNTSWLVLAEQNGMLNLGGQQWITALPEYVTYRQYSNGGSTSTSFKPLTGVATLKDNVNLRQAPNYSATKLRVLPKGTAWKVHGIQNGFYNVGENQWIVADEEYVLFSSNGTNSGSNTGSNSGSDNTGGSNTNASASKVINYAKQFIGVPYVWAGSTPSGFDCSGFVYYVLKQNGYNISRSNTTGYWNTYKATSSPKAGDLIFFKDTYQSGISHMGIYMGDNKFIHASSSHGVEINNLSNPYYKQHFAGYRAI